MSWRRNLAIGAVAVAAIGGGLFAARKNILLHALGVLTDIRHPRAANHEVPWEQGPAQAPAQRPPNIIVILADDLGYNDVSTNGAGIPHQPTPHIDSIARDGVRFERGYSGNAVCSPSRAALMTGRYPSRFGFEYTPTPGNMARVAPMMADPTRRHAIVVHPENAARIADFDELGVPPAEVTVAEVLRQSGYHTVHIGKWHLGSTAAMRPQGQGFDESLFMESGLYLPQDDPRVVNSRQEFDPIDKFLWPNMRYATSYNHGPWFEPRGYLTDYYTDEAVRVIHANRNRPFFLYLAHWAVHTPLQALKDDYDALAADIPEHRPRVYAAMVRALDRSVGRVLQALRDEGVDDNTLVVFTSDNGAPNYIGLPEANKPFRGWKLTLFEGGVRVPYFARWPGHIRPGSTLAAPVSSLDLLPTFAAAAGATLPTDRPLDGVNLLPYLAGENSAAPHDVMFWRDGSYRMVIARGWKLQIAERPKKAWLYHLDADPTEQVNLAEREPAKRAELEALLAAHDAQMQEPAWPSFVEMPVLVDKTLDQPDAADDEYVYWQN